MRRIIPSAAEFLAEIEAFKEAHGLSDTQFGTMAIQTHGFVRRLRDGRLDPKLSQIERVYRFMKTYGATK